jgi:hypothetical protein
MQWRKRHREKPAAERAHRKPSRHQFLVSRGCEKGRWIGEKTAETQAGDSSSAFSGTACGKTREFLGQNYKDTQRCQCTAGITSRDPSFWAASERRTYKCSRHNQCAFGDFQDHQRTKLPDQRSKHRGKFAMRKNRQWGQYFTGRKLSAVYAQLSKAMDET